MEWHIICWRSNVVRMQKDSKKKEKKKELTAFPIYYFSEKKYQPIYSRIAFPVTSRTHCRWYCVVALSEA